MGVYTNKLKEVNKGLDELIFLLNLCIEKKDTLEKLVKGLDNYNNEVIKSRTDILKNDANIDKIIEETTNCNKEFINYIMKISELEGLTYQLSYLDELKCELENIHDTFR